MHEGEEGEGGEGVHEGEEGEGDEGALLYTYMYMYTLFSFKTSLKRRRSTLSKPTRLTSGWLVGYR